MPYLFDTVYGAQYIVGNITNYKYITDPNFQQAEIKVTVQSRGYYTSHPDQIAQICRCAPAGTCTMGEQCLEESTMSLVRLVRQEKLELAGALWYN